LIEAVSALYHESYRGFPGGGNNPVTDNEGDKCRFFGDCLCFLLRTNKNAPTSPTAAAVTGSTVESAIVPPVLKSPLLDFAVDVTVTVELDAALVEVGVGAT
jgi:hypothetical protein